MRALFLPSQCRPYLPTKGSPEGWAILEFGRAILDANTVLLPRRQQVKDYRTITKSKWPNLGNLPLYARTLLAEKATAQTTVQKVNLTTQVRPLHFMSKNEVKTRRKKWQISHFYWAATEKKQHASQCIIVQQHSIYRALFGIDKLISLAGCSNSP